MKKVLLSTTVLLCMSMPFMAKADLSATLGFASDYLFNGVSQTDGSPAIQGSIDWSNSSGFYAGIWSSNVDFGDDTSIEADPYVGFYTTLDNQINIDMGLAQYTYQGASYSSDSNYAEAYIKANYENTDINFWYAWDYFGTGAGHYIVMLNHTFTISDDVSVLVGVDKSTSMDDDKWAWEPNEPSYIHWQVTSSFSYSGVDFSLGLHMTDLETYGDTSVVLSAFKTFDL